MDLVQGTQGWLGSGLGGTGWLGSGSGDTGMTWFWFGDTGMTQLPFQGTGMTRSWLRGYRDDLDPIQGNTGTTWFQFRACRDDSHQTTSTKEISGDKELVPHLETQWTPHFRFIHKDIKLDYSANIDAHSRRQLHRLFFLNMLSTHN